MENFHSIHLLLMFLFQSTVARSWKCVCVCVFVFIHERTGLHIYRYNEEHAKKEDEEGKEERNGLGLN